MAQTVKEFSRREYPVAAGANILEGDTVCLILSGTSAGYVISGEAGTNLRALGIANFAANNTSGGDGALTVEVARSICEKGFRTFLRQNDSGGGALTQANCGQKVYVKDNVTVTSTSAGNSVAGELDRIDSNGNPWVIFSISY